MKNRQKFRRKSGGIVLGYKQTLQSHIEIIKTESPFILWFKLSSKLLNSYEDLIIGIVYIPPENSVYASPDAFDQIEFEYRKLSVK